MPTQAAAIPREGVFATVRNRRGVIADVVADALSLPECPNEDKAFSVLETIRIGATQVLDMHMEDLQILFVNEQPDNPGHIPHANAAERRLKHLLMKAGFGEGIRGEQIDLGRAIGTTTPDVIYRGEHHDEDEGVCIYLDGLSQHIHGNPETQARDRRIRDGLRDQGWDVIEIAANQLSDRNAMTRHFRKLAQYLGAFDLRKKLKSSLAWFESETGPEKDQDAKPSLKIESLDQAEPYVRHLPLVPLQAAADGFGEPQYIEDGQWEEWVRIDAPHPLRPGMFVAQVVGHSMEPRIPDGAYCVFSRPVTGTRQGKTVLVQLRDQTDPETGERYTVKKYESTKEQSPDGPWRHVSITLKPLNPEYEPIHLTAEDEAEVSVIAELVNVLTFRGG